MWHSEDKLFQYQVGENRQGHEVKLDSRCTETGRLSIEIAEKTRASNHAWQPSGILRRDNSWLYIQGNYQRVFVFPKSWLVRYFLSKIEPSEIHESYGTVRKFYLPIETAMAGAALTLDGSGQRIEQELKGIRITIDASKATPDTIEQIGRILDDAR